MLHASERLARYPVEEDGGPASPPHLEITQMPILASEPDLEALPLRSGKQRDRHIGARVQAAPRETNGVGEDHSSLPKSPNRSSKASSTSREALSLSALGAAFSLATGGTLEVREVGL
jgi:hypothetical protein